MLCYVILCYVMLSLLCYVMLRGLKGRAFLLLCRTTCSILAFCFACWNFVLLHRNVCFPSQVRWSDGLFVHSSNGLLQSSSNLPSYRTSGLASSRWSSFAVRNQPSGLLLVHFLASDLLDCLSNVT